MWKIKFPTIHMGHVYFLTPIEIKNREERIIKNQLQQFVFVGNCNYYCQKTMNIVGNLVFYNFRSLSFTLKPTMLGHLSTIIKKKTQYFAKGFVFLGAFFLVILVIELRSDRTLEYFQTMLQISILQISNVALNVRC